MCYNVSSNTVVVFLKFHFCYTNSSNLALLFNRSVAQLGAHGVVMPKVASSTLSRSDCTLKTVEEEVLPLKSHIGYTFKSSRITSVNLDSV